MKYARSLATVNHNDADAVGERAVDLALLSTRGYKVPASFVLTNEAFEEFIRTNGLQQRIGEALAKYADKTLSYGLIRELILNAKMPTDIVSEVMDGYEALGIKQDGPVKELLETEKAPPVSVALSPNHTLPAEMMEGIVLGIHSIEKLLLAIKEVWACLFTPTMQEYRKSAGITNKNLNTGVVVQRLCKGELTGEAYSATEEHMDEVTIKAYYGFPSTVAKDEWRLTKELLKPVYHNLAIQTEMLSWDDEEKLGKVPIGERGEREKLPEKDVIELARLVRKAALELERPVKIIVDMDHEWKLFLCNRLLLTQGSIRLREAETEERIEDKEPLISESQEDRNEFHPDVEPESEGGLLEDIRPEPLPEKPEPRDQEPELPEKSEEASEPETPEPNDGPDGQERVQGTPEDVPETGGTPSTEKNTPDAVDHVPDAVSRAQTVESGDDDSIFSGIRPEDLNTPGPRDGEQRQR